MRLRSISTTHAAFWQDCNVIEAFGERAKQNLMDGCIANDCVERIDWEPGKDAFVVWWGMDASHQSERRVKRIINACIVSYELHEESR